MLVRDILRHKQLIQLPPCLTCTQLLCVIVAVLDIRLLGSLYSNACVTISAGREQAAPGSA